VLREKSRAALMRFKQTYSAEAVIPSILGVYETMLAAQFARA